MLVVPDDYIMPAGGPTIVREKSVHIVPVLSAEVRRKWLEAARDCDLDCVDGGIYWQTVGPRFETRAEIAMIAQFADLVGMTMASEAVIALALEKILRHARHNAEAILRILTRYVETDNRTAGSPA
jgi:5'-methylthioadenosine phosphorylase